MWIDDVLSFECLFNFLAVNDVFRLRHLNRYFYHRVKSSFVRCKKLRMISTSDIPIVSDRNWFPALKGFDTLCFFDGNMHSEMLKMLLHRWPSWHACSVSTRNHSRQAMKLFILNIRNIEKFELNIHPRTNIKVLLHMRYAMCKFFRANRTSLSSLSITGENMVSKIINPILYSRLQTLKIETANLSQNDFINIVSRLPYTLHDLTIKNCVSRSCLTNGHSVPYFLAPLAQRRHINRITLSGCVISCGILCESWNYVKAFCGELRANFLDIDFVRLDCVEALLNAGVKEVKAKVVGCPAPLVDVWKSKLPLSYMLDFLGGSGSCASARSDFIT